MLPAGRLGTGSRLHYSARMGAAVYGNKDGKLKLLLLYGSERSTTLPTLPTQFVIPHFTPKRVFSPKKNLSFVASQENLEILKSI